MELKFLLRVFSASARLSFNRTFMELKLKMLAPPEAVSLVLIVPLWN